MSFIKFVNKYIFNEVSYILIVLLLVRDQWVASLLFESAESKMLCVEQTCTVCGGRYLHIRGYIGCFIQSRLNQCALTEMRRCHVVRISKTTKPTSFRHPYCFALYESQTAVVFLRNLLCIVFE